MSFRPQMELAMQAARSAGDYLKSLDEKTVLSSRGRDIKLQADLESERMIITRLKEGPFDHPILAEESGEEDDHRMKDEPVWVIDPLDGSFNFNRGIGLCAVSIGLWTADRPLAGVVYDFHHSEMFSAVMGEGAWCNDQPIEVSRVKEPEKAALATGFPVNRDFESRSLQDFLKRIQRFKKLRLLGSAALSLAYVACGRVDAYAEEDIMFWDVAAGVALVHSAGGYCFYEDSPRKKHARTVLCAASESLWAT